MAGVRVNRAIRNTDFALRYRPFNSRTGFWRCWDEYRRVVIMGPDGKETFSEDDVLAGAGTVPDERANSWAISQGRISLSFNEKDPRGIYTCRTIIKDHISGVAVTRISRAHLEQAGAPMNWKWRCEWPWLNIHPIIGSTWVLVITTLLCSCVNIERDKIPSLWPQPVRAGNFAQLEGTYLRLAAGTIDDVSKRREPLNDIVYFLTGKHSKLGQRVRLAPSGSHEIAIYELDANGGVLASHSLKSKFRKGIWEIRSDAGFSGHPLGGGVGGGTLYLHCTTDGSLLGRTSGMAVGLAFWVVPTVGAGRDWFLWRKE